MKYFNLVNNKPPASWFAHITRDFLTSDSCSCYSSILIWNWCKVLMTWKGICKTSSHIFFISPTYFTCTVYQLFHLTIYIYIYIYVHHHHTSKCLSCHKAIVVITRKAHCFHDKIYIILILLLWDLRTLCVVDHLWPLIYFTYVLYHSYILKYNWIFRKEMSFCQFYILWHRMQTLVFTLLH